ncbi:MAG: thiamine biosynthesis protein ThiS [Robiginitomaculum sp.]|nr:MAG: thiamine biosynthesis protein ThiS [Robiginitomaculum sp.]
MQITITINGEQYADLTKGMSVSGLLAHLGLHEKKIAVERNREIVPKSGYKNIALHDGDVLEIITFIGGG